MTAEREVMRITHISGDPHHAGTMGRLCKSQETYLQNTVYHPYRLLQPHHRSEGSWSTWRATRHNLVVEELAQKVQQVIKTYSSKAILHIQGEEERGISRHLNTLFFRSLGGVLRSTPHLGEAAGIEAQRLDFGSPQTRSMKEIAENRLIILWGKNVAQTSIHLNFLIQKMRKRGTKVLLIDPIFGPTSRYADAHYPVAPGGDSALILALILTIMKEGWCDEEGCQKRIENFSTFKSALSSLEVADLCRKADIAPKVVENIARIYTSTRPALIVAGRGMLRTPRGGQVMRLLDALSIISGFSESPGGVWFHQDEPGLSHALSDSIDHPNEEILSVPEIMDRLAHGDPPIKMVFINNANPVHSWPSGRKLGQALMKIPTVVHMGKFLNDTSDVATHFIVTPTIFERLEIVLSPFTGEIILTRPFIAPRGECRTEFTTYQHIARRVGLTHPVHPYWWYMQQLIAPYLKAGVSLDALHRGPQPIPSTLLQTNTGAGKSEVITRWDLSYDRTRDFPLALICPSKRKWETQAIPPDQQAEEIVALVNPDTLQKLHLSSGQRAILKGEGGTVPVIVQDDESQRPDVVVVPFGKCIPQGGNVTNVVPPLPTDIGKGVTFQGTGVILK